MRTSVRSAVAIAIVTVGVGTGVTVSAVASATTGAKLATCYATNLRPSYGGQQGAAGTVWDTWRVTNVGSATCTVNGFPTVENYRSDGRPLATAVSLQGGHSTVTLTTGQHASFLLGYPQPDISGCTPQPATQMTITTPGAATPLLVTRGEPACYGTLEERALIAGG